MRFKKRLKSVWDFFGWVLGGLFGFWGSFLLLGALVLHFVAFMLLLSLFGGLGADPGGSLEDFHWCFTVGFEDFRMDWVLHRVVWWLFGLMFQD